MKEVIIMFEKHKNKLIEDKKKLLEKVKKKHEEIIYATLLEKANEELEDLIKNSFSKLEKEITSIFNEIDVLDEDNQINLKEKLESIVPVITWNVSLYEQEEKPNENKSQKLEPTIVYNAEKLKEKLTEKENEIVSIIGKTGVCRTKELLREIDCKDPKEIFEVIKRLRKYGVIDSEMFYFGNRKKYNFTVFELSETGKEHYTYITGEEPIESNKVHLTREFGTLNRAIFVSDVKEILEERGNEVELEHEIVDMVIKKENENMYIIFDFDDREEEDLKNRLNILFSKTKKIYLIAQNDATLYGKTKLNIFKWNKKRKSVETVHIFFSTYEMIRNGDWEKYTFSK